MGVPRIEHYWNITLSPTLTCANWWRLLSIRPFLHHSWLLCRPPAMRKCKPEQRHERHGHEEWYRSILLIGWSILHPECPRRGRAGEDEKMIQHDPETSGLVRCVQAPRFVRVCSIVYLPFASSSGESVQQLGHSAVVTAATFMEESEKVELRPEAVVSTTVEAEVENFGENRRISWSMEIVVRVGGVR